MTREEIIKCLSDSVSQNQERYFHLERFIDLENIQYYEQKKQTLIDSLNNSEDYIGILNVHFYGNSICRKNFNEIKEICNLFSNDSFYFLTNCLKNDEIKTILFKFPQSLEWDFFSNHCDNFGEFFFSANIESNFWLGENWGRKVGTFDSDLYIPRFNTVIDFPYELIIIERKYFSEIQNVYSKKYGEFLPICKCYEFFEIIFEDDFKFLLSDNIYVTAHSVNYIKNQII